MLHWVMVLALNELSPITSRPLVSVLLIALPAMSVATTCMPG